MNEGYPSNRIALFLYIVMEHKPYSYQKKRAGIADKSLWKVQRTFLQKGALVVEDKKTQ
jgi:hypothetical protein